MLKMSGNGEWHQKLELNTSVMGNEHYGALVPLTKFDKRKAIASEQVYTFTPNSISQHKTT